MQNPIQSMLRFQIFQVFFFKNLIFFTVSNPYTAQVRKVKSPKKHFLVLFYSAKSISDLFTNSELFQVFFPKSIFFTFSNPIMQRWETWGQKKSVLGLFYSAKSNSDHVTILNFSSFFSKKLILFTVSTPILHKWEKWSQQKITFECSLTVQKPFQAILGI